MGFGFCEGEVVWTTLRADGRIAGDERFDSDAEVRHLRN